MKVIVKEAGCKPALGRGKRHRRPVRKRSFPGESEAAVVQFAEDGAQTVTEERRAVEQMCPVLAGDSARQHPVMLPGNIQKDFGAASGVGEHAGKGGFFGERSLCRALEEKAAVAVDEIHAGRVGAAAVVDGRGSEKIRRFRRCVRRQGGQKGAGHDGRPLFCLVDVVSL